MDFLEHLNTFMIKEDAIKLFNSLQNAPFKAFRVNSLKCDQIFDLLENVSLEPHKHVKNAYLYKNEEAELGKSIFFRLGAYYIQEPAAMLSETLLNIQKDDIVLDMCAAPGGKTFDALIDMEDRGFLVCNDIHVIRSKILSSNIEKYGFKNCLVLNDDSSKYKKYFQNYFSKIILDAPCSGSGMFRKDALSREEWSIEKVYECKEIQLKLIEDAYDMLKADGTLLYSTCSFSIQENEEVINSFLIKHSDMELLPISLSSLYHDSIGFHGGLRLYPYQYDGEGQCMFLLKKKKVGVEQGSHHKIIKTSFVDKAVLNFLDSLSFTYEKKNILNFNEHYYYAEFDKIDLKGIKFNRYGLELGYIENKRFIPSHALALYHFKDTSNFIELSYEDSLNYLRGLTIPYEGNRGFVIVAYKGLALGWAKLSNNTLKNHLPKGLRINY